MLDTWRRINNISRGATCSFAGNTLVNTQSGFRAIADLELGDQVWSRNQHTGEMAFKPITAHYQNRYPDTVEITTQDQVSGDAQTLSFNHTYLFFVWIFGGTQASLFLDRRGVYLVIGQIM